MSSAGVDFAISGQGPLPSRVSKTPRLYACCENLERPLFRIDACTARSRWHSLTMSVGCNSVPVCAPAYNVSVADNHTSFRLDRFSEAEAPGEATSLWGRLALRWL